MENTKNILKSRTFWLACTQAVIGGLVILMTEMDAVGGIVIVKSIGDVILRLLTFEAVKV